MEKTRKYHTVDESLKKLINESPYAEDIFRQAELVEDRILCDPERIEKFCGNIREEREKRNSPQVEIADIMDISQFTISRYENLCNKKISNHTRAIKSRRAYLKAFCLTYDVSPLYLIGMTSYPRSFERDKDMIGSEDDGLIDPFSFLIVMKLFDADDLSYIKTFERICFDTESGRKEIRKYFNIPSISKYIDTERSNLTSSFYADLAAFMEENGKSYKKIRSFVRSFELLRKKDQDLYNIIVNVFIGTNTRTIKALADLMSIC